MTVSALEAPTIVVTKSNTKCWDDDCTCGPKLYTCDDSTCVVNSEQCKYYSSPIKYQE